MSKNKHSRLNPRPVLSFGLLHNLINQNKCIKTDVTAQMEYLAYSLSLFISDDQIENFYRYPRSRVNQFSQNVFNTTDTAWK